MTDPINMPSLTAFGACTFELVSSTQIFQSPLTGQTQTLDLGWDVWQANYQLPPMRNPQAGAWRGFLARLRGRSGRFYAADPLAQCSNCGALANGVDGVDADGNELLPAVDLYPAADLYPGGTYHPGQTFSDPTLTLSVAAAKGDISIVVTGLTGFDYADGVNPNWEADQTLICAGAYIQLGTQLLMLTAPVRAPTCGGGVKLNFAPVLRSAFAAGTEVVYSGAVAIMRLTDDQQASWNESPGGIYTISFTAVEDY